MARSKKKALSQKVVGVATSGMPSPVRKFLGTRIIALLIVLAIPVLFATGLVSIKWENGRPRLSINQQKASQVKTKAAEKIQKLRDERSADRPAAPSLGSRLSGPENSRAGFADERQDNGFGDKAAERIGELKDRLGEDRGQSPGFAAETVEQENAAKRADGPFSRLKKRFDTRR